MYSRGMSENLMITAANAYVIITDAWINADKTYGELTAIDGVIISVSPKFAQAAKFMLRDIQESVEHGAIRGKVVAGLNQTADVWTICES